DKIYRLTDWKRKGRPGGRLREEQSWDLDLLGNWAETAYDSTTEKRRHNEVNELTGIRKNGSERTLTYDPAGNLTDDDNQIYIYNYRNLLTEIREKSSGDTVAKYTYDASSRRRTKKLPGPGNSSPSTIVFLYDGWKVLEERDGDGNILAEYTHGLYIDEYVTIETGGKRTYYHQDTIYNVKALTDEKGKVIERYAYTAYGEPSVLNKNGMPVPQTKVRNRYLFQGRRLDRESGLYYFRLRMMSGELGRFLQRDPVGYLSGSMGLYVYVDNKGPNATDAYGLIKTLTRQIAVHEGKNVEFAMQNKAPCDNQMAARKLKARMNEIADYEGMVETVGYGVMKSTSQAAVSALNSPMFSEIVRGTLKAKDIEKAYLESGTEEAFAKAVLKSVDYVPVESVDMGKVQGILEKAWAKLQTAYSDTALAAEGPGKFENGKERTASNCRLTWRVGSMMGDIQTVYYKIRCVYIRYSGLCPACAFETGDYGKVLVFKKTPKWYWRGTNDVRMRYIWHVIRK
ncbi:MAG: RHS repeat domain-containing protein, partial [Candidatus Brocadiia bacterium]